MGQSNYSAKTKSGNYEFKHNTYWDKTHLICFKTVFYLEYIIKFLKY